MINKATNFVPATTTIEIEFKCEAPLVGSDDYQIDRPEFTEILAKVQLKQDCDRVFIERTIALQEKSDRIIDDPQIYQIVGFELVHYEQDGRLIEHPYWLYVLNLPL